MASDLKVISPDAEWAARKLATMDPAIKRGFTKQMRAETKPVGLAILEAYGQAMPHRGGLAERIRSRGRVSVLAQLRTPAVYLTIRNGSGMYMAAFEKGQVRHLVYGRWVPNQPPQPVPANVGRISFESQAERVAAAVSQALNETIWKALTQ